MTRALPTAALIALLTGCAVRDPGPTLETLDERAAKFEPTPVPKTNTAEAIAQYQALLDPATDVILQAAALKRIADLKMEEAERIHTEGDDRENAQSRRARAQAYYQEAASLYEALIADYPDYRTDLVLYQLSNAYDQLAKTQQQLSVLERLAEQHPDSRFYPEAQFRRAELLFVDRDYAASQRVYASVLERGDNTPFFERSLYKYGWTQFKKSNYQESLVSFSRLLDRKLLPDGSEVPIDPRTLARGEREMLNDTLRAISLSCSYLDSGDSVKALFARIGPRPYEPMIYRALGDFYLAKERFTEAADAYTAFTEMRPDNPEAPGLRMAAIDALKQGGFASLVIAEKSEFVERYGVESEFWKKQDAATRQKVAPHLKRNIVDLARYHHAKAQEDGSPESYTEAARWYRSYLRSFPEAEDRATANLLLAQALYESKDFLQAATEFEKTAYSNPGFEKGAEAAYGALVAYADQEKRLQGNALESLRLRQAESAIRFVNTFPGDTHLPDVLAKAADYFYRADKPQQAAAAAERLVTLKPAARAELQRTGWTILAYTQFNKQQYVDAERSFRQLIRFTSSSDPERPKLVEYLAEAIYKQGEAKRESGDIAGAVVQFLRVSMTSPNAKVRPIADYDAATALMELKQWERAAQILESFRKRFPEHPLAGNVSEKLAVAYGENGNPLAAARELEVVSASSNKRPEVRREAAWKAAELYEKSNSLSEAVRAFERYVADYNLPLEPAMEARNKLALLTRKQGERARSKQWLREILAASAKHPGLTTDRTRHLAAAAALELARPFDHAFRKVRLTAPLKASLNRKKKQMQAALELYSQAANYGIAGITTEATFRMARIYAQLSRDLMDSQRPQGLSEEQTMQYQVLLEQQAFPFEEKAIEIHEANAARAREGVFDEWVKKSFSELARLFPAQYAREEQGEAFSNAIN